MQKRPDEPQNKNIGGQSAVGTDLLQQAIQTTSEVVDLVQQQAGSRLNRQKDEAADDLKKVADAVRQVGDGLNREEAGPIAQYAAEYGKKAAESIERLTNYLRTNDTKKLVTEVENFGRRQPVLLLGGAFLLGFAGARFLKSSAAASNEFNNGPNVNRALPPPPAPQAQPPRPISTSATAL
jgi:hypothetical protein